MSAINPPGYNDHLFQEQHKKEEQQEKNSGVQVNGHQPPACGGKECGHNDAFEALKDGNVPRQPI